MTAPDPPSLSREQVADILGVWVTSVDRWIKLGLLTSWLDEHGRRRISADDVLRYLYPR